MFSKCLSIVPLSLLLAACIFSEALEPALAVSGLPKDLGYEESFKLQKSRLDKVLKKIPGKKALFADFFAYLDARQAEREGNAQQASRSWLVVMKSSKNAEIRERAFKGFLENLRKDLGTQDPILLYRLLLKEVRREKLFPMKLASRTFQNVDEIAQGIESFSSTGELQLSASKKPVAPPTTKGVPEYDISLKKTAKGFCYAGKMDYRWLAWKKTLHPLLQDYWQALVHRCKRENKQAIAILMPLSFSLAEQPETLAFGIYAYEVLVKLLRLQGSRFEAASIYQKLFSAWQQPGLSPKTMGLSVNKFIYKKANDMVWAARYQALVGNYSVGKIYLKAAEEYIQSNLQKLMPRDKKSVEDMSALLAEVKHVLSFRILFEEKKYQQAYSVATEGMKIQNLPDEWQAHFLWLSGLLAYLQQNRPKAIEHWNKVLLKQQYLVKGDVHPKILYWLTRAHLELKQKEPAIAHFKRLTHMFPLSYYTVVALSSLSKEASLKHRFPAPTKMLGALNSTKNYRIRPMRRVKSLANTLLRMEISLVGNLKELSPLIGRKLYHSLKKRVGLKKSPESYLYTSRLLFAAGNFLESVLLSSELGIYEGNLYKKWPEQLFITYPQAYKGLMGQYSKQLSMDHRLLLAIARRESLFNANAESSAQAYGVMQLIMPTAKLMAKGLRYKVLRTYEDLFTPAVNIHLGSRLVKKLSLRYNNKNLQVFAAYNAGETAVDLWGKSRQLEDPLLWVEFIPFAETRTYVKQVWKNHEIYKFLDVPGREIAIKYDIQYKKYASKIREQASVY